MNCKGCGRKVPERALHFSNRIAIEHSYCNWACFQAHDKNESEKAFQEYKKGEKNENL